jgi:leucyl-tRNA synthetase
MVLKDGVKMSKSAGNTVDPQDLLERYGADTVRLFMMFTAPPDQALEWSDSGVAGANRFLKRLWKTVAEHVDAGGAAAVTGDAAEQAVSLRRKLHETIAKVSDDIGRRYTFNTAVAAVMELLNAINRTDGDADGVSVVRHEALEAIVLMLSPIVPHITHELWRALGHAGAIVDQPWPRVDESALAQEAVEVVVQVNGRLRARVTVPADAAEETVIAAALADENVQRHIEGKTVRKTIYVPGKLVNVVV